jgi:hypothetical protein
MSWKLGLTFFSNQVFIINPFLFELKELKKIMRENNFHIYLICKRKSDLEVLYIGQSYGRNKKRQIDKRLTNHEKLQKIALEIIQKGTLEEVLVIGLNYLVKDLATALVTVDTDRSQFSLENLIKLKNNASKRIPESQEVTVYEAALINYFQTELNIEYREKFPSLGYSSYEEIYKTKFDYTSMEINTYDTGKRIFSKNNQDRKYNHIKQFALDSEAQKKDFFDFLFSEQKNC